MRLDKFLSNNTDLSRREVKYLIRDGLVVVNDVVLKSASTHIDEDARVVLDGDDIKTIGLGYFMLNKPEGFVCANKDSEHPTVFDLIREPNADLHVAGRLDIDTTGLVLITGDGKWSHRVTSPRHECVKVYRVWTEEFITQNMIDRLEAGVFLQTEKIRTKPAEIEKIAEDEILLSISEGKYHQVKRMLHSVGNAVDRLHRESVGHIALDDSLAPGEYRALTPDEIERV